jgi:hypothetical protein
MTTWRHRVQTTAIVALITHIARQGFVNYAYQ